ncbi:MAG: M15 family metallopeptidase [Rhodothermales bacterium]|nr:M15 family metallopeptidase [Rhodothermales bacterium]
MPEIREEALQLSPPVETGQFRSSELVELVVLDSTIALNVRYATDQNFMGTVLYSEPRAFLQRPAAEALKRVQAKLSQKGVGLVIYDAYRPWYVTKMFWEATPRHQREFVANPRKGSMHNRGCAVDLGLIDLSTGEILDMPSGYDEFSERAYADYSGGTKQARKNRDLLRREMEAEGYRVNSGEWWHFDYKDWRSYRIQNRRFEEIN